MNHPPRLLLYSADRLGIGHLRTTLAVAGAVTARRPAVEVRVFTGLGDAAGFAKPRNVEWVVLPEVEETETAAAGLKAQRVDAIQQTIADWLPDLFAVDHAPAGLDGDLIYPLASLRAADPRVDLMLGLADIDGDPAAVRPVWAGAGVYDLLDRTYDRIAVAGDRDLFDPTVEYGFSTTAADKTVFCGYLGGPDPSITPKRIRDDLGVGADRLIVVTAGDAADGGPLIRAYLSACRMRLIPDGAISLIDTGPLRGGAERQRIERAADGLARVKVVRSLADRASILNAADLVVTTGDLDVLSIAVRRGTRVLVVPPPRAGEVPQIRAQRFAGRGLVRMMPAERLGGAPLAGMVWQTLAESPSENLPRFGGLDAIADLIVAAIRR